MVRPAFDTRLIKAPYESRHRIHDPDSSIGETDGTIEIASKKGWMRVEETMEESVKHESCGTGERKSHHSPKTKNNLISRLNRIEGQIRGIKGLIEKDTYCDDVLNQISSVQSALNGVSKLLLEHHMKSCLIERIQDGENEVIDELLVTINKLMK